MSLRLGAEVCRDVRAATGREWIETNGIGGLSSSTVAGLNTRRYHGLLTAATKPALGRTLPLLKLEETLIVDSCPFHLSANQARVWLEGFLEHSPNAGLGQITEILDAEAPHRPRGCIARAWSVAELLRTAVEDIFEAALVPCDTKAVHAS